MDATGKHHLPILSTRVAAAIVRARGAEMVAMVAVLCLSMWSTSAHAAPLQLGEACARASECGSGFCVDEVCCESACEGACLACSPSWGSSEPGGTCGPVEAGIDPRGDCTAGSDCGNTGLCDGNGACAVADVGTPCGVSGRCAADGECANVLLCDQDQTILGAEGPLTACAPMRCSTVTNTCITTCTGNRDCVDGFACSVEGRCEAAVESGAEAGCSAAAEGRGGVQGGYWGWSLLCAALGLWALRREGRERASRV